jgi:hypothetical protein
LEMHLPEFYERIGVSGSTLDILKKRKVLFENMTNLQLRIMELGSGKVALSEVKQLFLKVLLQIQEFQSLNKQLGIMGEVMLRTPFLCSDVNKFDFTNTELDELVLEIHELLTLPHSDFYPPGKIKDMLFDYNKKLNGLIKKYEAQQNNIIFDSWYMDIGECD